MSTKRKTMLIINIIGLICLMIGGYYLGKCNKNKNDYILNNGINSTAVIINRTASYKNYSKRISYQIDYDFSYNKKMYVKKGYEVSNEEYQKCIIGMVYKITHLNEKPHINSIIHIDKPLKTEFANIELERLRIKETYKNADVFLRKNARPLEDIQHLLK